MIRLGRQHRRNARAWMIDLCTVLRYRVETGEWLEFEYACVVQQPKGYTSGADAEFASSEETAAMIVYIDPVAEVDVGDRIRWEGETFLVNTSSFRRSEQPYRKLTCSTLQSGLVPELVTFYRIVHNADGEVAGRETVGDFAVRFTEGFQVDASLERTGARGHIREGKVLAPLEADGIVVGDWFDRRGVPGRVTAVDRSAPDHIELTYISEKAVP